MVLLSNVAHQEGTEGHLDLVLAKITQSCDRRKNKEERKNNNIKKSVNDSVGLLAVLSLTD